MEIDKEKVTKDALQAAASAKTGIVHAVGDIKRLVIGDKIFAALTALALLAFIGSATLKIFRGGDTSTESATEKASNVSNGNTQTSSNNNQSSSSQNVIVKGNDIIIKNEYNDDVAKRLDGVSVNPKYFNLSLKDIGNDDLVKIISRFTQVHHLNIESTKLTSVDALKNLTNADSLSIKAENVSDFSSLSGLASLKNLTVESEKMSDVKWMSNMISLTSFTLRAGSSLTSLEGIPNAQNLTSFSIYSANISDLSPISVLKETVDADFVGCSLPDLTPLTNLQKLKDLNLYGATVKDLTPLGKIPTLRSLMIYATKDTDYSTLAELKNVRDVNFGMTKVHDISFVKEMPNLRGIKFFSEEVTDFTPINGTDIEYVKIWSMKQPVDLSQIKGATKMKKIEIDSCGYKNKQITNFDALSNMKLLEEIKITGLDKDCDSTVVDGNFASGLNNVKILYLNKIAHLTNTSAFADLIGAEKVTFSKISADKAIDGAFFAKMSGLKEIHIEDTAFTGYENLGKCSNLEIADIPALSDMKAIAALKKLPKLRSITVRKKVSDSDLKDFANPKIRINKK